MPDGSGTSNAVNLADLLRALAHEDAENWAEAHAAVAELAGPLAAWLHAHLHRVEGDLDNARYWYRQARRPAETGPLAEERAAIGAAVEAAARS